MIDTLLGILAILSLVKSELYFQNISTSCLIATADRLTNCLECKSMYYMEEEAFLNSSITRPFDSSLCQLKREEQPLKVRQFFVGLGYCTKELKDCSGSLESPFPSIISAFNYINKEIKGLIYSEVFLYILRPENNSEYFILDNEIPPEGIDYFRGSNISLYISSKMCSDNSDQSCYPPGKNSVLHIKTERFALFIMGKLVIKGISFLANDIHVSDEICLTSNQVCCTRELLELSRFSEPCGLKGYYLESQEFPSLKGKRSFINFYPSEYDFNAPQLEIHNCSFENWYLIKKKAPGAGWSSLIGTFKYFNFHLIINNVSIGNTFFPSGIFMTYDFSEHFLYYVLDNKDRESLSSYLISEKINSTIVTDSFIVHEYNKLGIQIGSPQNNSAILLSFLFSIYPKDIKISFFNASLKDCTCPTASCSIFIVFPNLYYSANTISTSFVEVNHTTFENLQNFGIIYSSNIFAFLNFCMLSNLFFNVGPMFDLKEGSYSGFNHVSITNTFNHVGKPLFNVQEGSRLIFYNKTTFNFSIQILFLCSDDSVIKFDSTFLLNLINDVVIFDTHQCEAIEFARTIVSSVWVGFYFHDSEDDKSILYSGSIFTSIRSLTFLNSFAKNQLVSILVNTTIFEKFDTSYVGKVEDDRSNYIIYPFSVKEILFLNSTVRNSRGLIILRAYYWFSSIVFEGCLFDNLIDVKYYLILVYQGRDPFKGYEKHIIKSCMFSNSTISINKYWFYPSFFPLFEMTNVFIYNISHNLTGAPGLTRKIMLAQRTLTEEKIQNLTIIFVSNVKMISMIKSHEVERSIYKNVRIFNLLDENPRVPGIQIENFPITSQKKFLAISNSIFFNLRFLAGTKADNLEGRGGALSINCLESYDTNVTVYENEFLAVRGNLLKGGVFSSSSCGNINFRSNTVNISSGEVGGALYIENSQKVFISDNIFMNVQSFGDGGTLFSYFVTNMTIKNTSVENSSALQQGGAFKISNTAFILADTLRITESRADSAGVIRLSSCDYALFSRIFAKNFSSQRQAGFLSIYRTNILIDDAHAVNGYAFSGTFFEITHPESQIQMNNISAAQLTAVNEGAFLLTSNLRGLIASNILITQCGVMEAGRGVIAVMGFVYTEKMKGSLTFCNIECDATFGRIGSCFFISSNNNISLRNVLIIEGRGTPLCITSDSTTEIVIAGLAIIKSNKNTDFAYQKDLKALVDVLKSNLTINSLYVYNNAFGSSLLHFDGGTVQIFQAKISQNFLIATPNYYNAQANIFEISEATVLILNMTLEGLGIREENLCGAYLISNALLLLDTSVVSGFQTKSFAPLRILNSNVRIYKGMFFNNSGRFAGVIYCQSSQFYLGHSSFSNNYILDGQKNANDYISNIKERAAHILHERVTSFNEMLTFVVEDTEFLNSNGFFLNIKNIDSVSIRNSVFKASEYSSSLNSSSAIYHFNVETSKILKSFFQNLRSLKGSAIWLEAKTVETNFSFYSTVLIEECNFNNGNAFIGGALYAEGQNKVEIIMNSFTGNRAIFEEKWSFSGVGGVAAFDCEFYEFCEAEFQDNTFENNEAELFGSTVLVKTTKFQEANNTFVNNSDSMNFSAEFSFLPYRAFFLATKNQSSLELASNSNFKIFLKEEASSMKRELNIASGQPFNFTLMLTDSNFNLLIFDNTSKALIQRPSFENSSWKFLIEKELSIAKQGILNFYNVRIVIKPDQSIKLEILVSIENNLLFASSLPGNSSGGNQISLIIDLYVRPCIIGEIFLDDLTCFKCHTGTFSLIDPMEYESVQKCENCIENAFCPGGADILVEKGFWRNGLLSSIVLKCLSTGACIGNIDQAISNICAIHHQGPFCGECDSDSTKFRDEGACIPCEEATIVYLKISAFFIVLIFYVYVQTNIFSKLERKAPHAPACLRLALNHFQMLGIINLVKFDWTKDFLNFFSLQDKLSFLTDDYLVIDCVVRLGINPFLTKTLATCVFPFVFTFAMLIWWILINLISSFIKGWRAGNYQKQFFIDWSFVFERMRITFLIVLYIFHPEILRKCFNLLNCVLIDNHTQLWVILKAPGITCWEKDHLFWLYIMVLPAISFWGLIIPFFLFLILKLLQKYIFLLRDLLEAGTNEISALNPNSSLKVQPFEIVKVKKKANFKHEIKNLLNSTPSSDTHADIFKDRLDEVKARKAITSSKHIAINSVHYNTNFSSELFKNGMISLKEISKEKFKNFENEKYFLMKLRLTMNLGFLFRGYSKEHYYWEMIVFARKTLLLFSAIISEVFPIQAKATIFQLILIFFLFVQIKTNPGLYKYLNFLETGSLVVAFIMGNIGLLLNSPDTVKIASFLLAILVTANLLLLIFWGYCIQKYVIDKTKIRNFFQNLKRSGWAVFIR